MTARVLDMTAHRKRLAFRALTGARDEGDMLASVIDRLPDNLARFESLTRRGFHPDSAREAMARAGYTATGDVSSPCANPKCARRIAPKQRVAFIGQRVFCGATCAGDWLDAKGVERG